MVNDKGILACADSSLTGEVKVTGVIGKGTYQCTWNGDWHPEAYDDYALLAAKLAPTATVLDVTDAARWDEDWTAIKAKCPNIEIRTTATAISLHPSAFTRQTSDIKYHNLGGQRVAQPVNGLYIVNGKKVIKK
jgi:hypothetical protein